MKARLSKNPILFIVLVIIFIGIGCENQKKNYTWTLPCLPRPIAEETVLITSAGQSADTYIVEDIANQLMIHNLFMPQARKTDLEDIKTLVVVVGYSPIGMKSRDISYNEEKNRILRLLEKSESNNLTVITLYIGGRQRRSTETDELLQLVSPKTDYLISLQEANFDGFFIEIAKKYNIPLTLVKSVNDISEPFASAFR